MPSFLPRTLSGKKRESAKAVQSSGNPAPSSPSRFRVLSRSSSRPASSSSAVEGGNPANRGVLSRTPTATANSGRGGRAGVNGSGPSVTVDPLQSGGGVPGQTLSSPSPRSNQPQSPLNNVAGASAVNNQGSDRLVSSRNSNPGLLPNQGRGSSLQGNNPQQPPQRGLSEANGYSSPLRNSPNLPPMPLQNSQQQLRRLTTSPPIRTARSPVQDGPYPSINEFQRPGPTLALDSTDLTNSNLGVDRYPHPHGAPRHGPFNLQRNGAASYQNRDRNLFRSQKASRDLTFPMGKDVDMSTHISYRMPWKGHILPEV
ncbi:hypothetical protein BDZ91DRAFT_54421 [Kalaharituber pfeilii]|nr:hypothetical protein BDZ91DRAFT_54421 [Kalaharituber pfeilii]